MGTTHKSAWGAYPSTSSGVALLIQDAALFEVMLSSGHRLHGSRAGLISLRQALA